MSDYASKSWWLESLPEPIVANAPLAGAQKADVTVIGGGYTGLSTACHLKRLDPGIDVRVVEADVCGYGASGRNGGFSMTLFGLTKGITRLRFDDRKARAAHRYMEAAVDGLHALITENRIDCDYERSGYLLVGTSPAQVRRVEHDFEIIEKWGVTGIERWDRQRLAEEFNTDYYQVGWFEPRCGIVQPAKLARGMKALAEKLGARIYENSPVARFSKNTGGGYTVKTATGELRSDYLVLATNAYAVLFPQLRSLQRPVFTHIVMTEPLSADRMARIGWRCRAGVEDARDLIHYYRLTRDNRIAMGGGDVSLTYGDDLDRDLNEKIFAHLERHVTEVFPRLRGIRFTHRWGGPVSVTLDMAPVIGFLGADRTAIFSLGCIGHGVSLSQYNGLTIAELITGRRTWRTGMFFVGRKVLPWPADPVTHGAVHAIRGFMKLEDRIYYK
jgi:glycine/D-amino acid oxidase-like deaminating enzyme